jgi:hypothetical protein
VLVAGASGVIGGPLVRQLVAAGHEVTGTTSSPARTGAIEAAGARPATCDALDSAAVSATVAAARPEVVVNELTRLPREYNPRTVDYEPTNRVRREGGKNLLEAARSAGVRRFVTQSIAFIYAPEGPRVLDEDARPWTEAPGGFRDGVATLLEHERAVVEADGLDGLVLRYGQFYGPGTYFAPDGSIARRVAKRQFPIIVPRRGRVLVHPHRRRRRGDGRRGRARRGGDLQRHRRRAGAAAGMAAGLRRRARRQASLPDPDLRRADLRRQLRRADGERAARRVEREGEARARLGAALLELAPGLP